MPRFIRKHKILTIVLALVSCFGGFVGWVGSSRIRGRLVARIDLARGNYAWLEAGHGPPWFSDCVRLLQNRYEIETREVNCALIEPCFVYIMAYNEVSIEANRDWALHHPIR